MIQKRLNPGILHRIAVASLLFVSCQSPAQQPQEPSVIFLATEASQSLAQETGNAHQFSIRNTPGASIRFALQWSKPDPGFQTQLACTIDSHLDHFKVYLLRADTSLGATLPLNLGTLTNPVEGPFTIGKKALTSPAGSENFVFRNVPEGKYYVAMSAHNASDTNITGTSLSSPTGLLGLNLVAVSNGGGNAGAPGRVEVGPAPDFLILNGTEPALTLSLKLSSILCL